MCDISKILFSYRATYLTLPYLLYLVAQWPADPFLLISLYFFIFILHTYISFNQIIDIEHTPKLEHLFPINNATPQNGFSQGHYPGALR